MPEIRGEWGWAEGSGFRGESGIGLGGDRRAPTIPSTATHPENTEHFHHVRVTLRSHLGMGISGCMARPEEYRRYAEECLKLASSFQEPLARSALCHMAVWLRLAQDAENPSRSPQDEVSEPG